MQLQRRTFLKTIAYSMAGSLFMGKEISQLLIGTTYAAEGSTGELKIDLAQFPALQNPNGSVRLALNPFTTNRPNGAYYPILINRLQSGDYVAINSRCSHADCVVNPFSSAANACICPCHGSRFGIDGSRISGPAPRNLDQYNLRQEGEETLIVEVPGLNYSVQMTPTPTASGDVVELSFPTQDRVSYEVLFRTDLQSDWSAVEFGNSSEGPFNLLESTGNGSDKSVFVQPQGDTGFFSVAVVVTEQ